VIHGPENSVYRTSLGFVVKKAQTEPDHQEHWIDEAIKWLERAIEQSGDGAVFLRGCRWTACPKG